MLATTAYIVIFLTVKLVTIRKCMAVFGRGLIGMGFFNLRIRKGMGGRGRFIGIVMGLTGERLTMFIMIILITLLIRLR